jgi:D-glycero-D-manno-heptose 1,7-bisphosphate phosphatase
VPLWKCQPNAPLGEPRPVLFLDRDGVLVEDRNYLADPDQIRILPGVVPALVRARAAGYWLVGVTNQSGLGRGIFKEEDFQAVMLRLHHLLEKEDVALDAFFYCPHAPDDGCDCRKPRPGMVHEAEKILPLEKQGSWVIGDKESDVALGQKTGLGSILVRTGYGSRQEAKTVSRWGDRSTFRVVDDLAAAIEYILQKPLAGERI